MGYPYPNFCFTCFFGALIEALKKILEPGYFGSDKGEYKRCVLRETPLAAFSPSPMTNRT